MIDWDRRFDLMQQHSGEHIVSGLAHYLWGCENVGFHLGAEVVTIDFDRPLTEKQFATLEETANWHLWQINEPVKITYPSPEELEQIRYRSKKALTGQVRIVEFPGADCCACCGTHVNYPAQVGLVKLLSMENSGRACALSWRRGTGPGAVRDHCRSEYQGFSAAVRQGDRHCRRCGEDAEGAVPAQGPGGARRQAVLLYLYQQIGAAGDDGTSENPE